MTIHHPQMSKLIAYQRHWLAIEIPAPFLWALLSKIALSIPYLSHPHTHLCGLKVGNGHLKKFEPFGVIGDGGVVGMMQRADLNAAYTPLCRGCVLNGLADHRCADEAADGCEVQEAIAAIKM